MLGAPSGSHLAGALAVNSRYELVDTDLSLFCVFLLQRNLADECKKDPELSTEALTLLDRYFVCAAATSSHAEFQRCMDAIASLSQRAKRYLDSVGDPSTWATCKYPFPSFFLKSSNYAGEDCQSALRMLHRSLLLTLLCTTCCVAESLNSQIKLHRTRSTVFQIITTLLEQTSVK
jgi:hypothetical protein